MQDTEFIRACEDAGHWGKMCICGDNRIFTCANGHTHKGDPTKLTCSMTDQNGVYKEKILTICPFCYYEFIKANVSTMTESMPVD